MTQEDKDLLLKDLCTRLPYGVKGIISYNGDKDVFTLIGTYNTVLHLSDNEACNVEDFKPYLRPMSSMTDDEKDGLSKFGTNDKWDEDGVTIETEGTTSVLLYYHCLYIPLDWLNAHHFDYRGLIEKGLAIAVIEDNNPYK